MLTLVDEFLGFVFPIGAWGIPRKSPSVPKKSRTYDLSNTNSES